MGAIRQQEESGERAKSGHVAARSPLESILSLFGEEPKSGAPLPKLAVPSDPVVLGGLSALAGVGLAFGGIYAYRKYWRRIKNANDVTGRMLDQQRWIKGVVTTVGDGDNFRLYHTPGPFFTAPFKIRSVPTTAKELRHQTVHIRISGVDAPENAHFGNPAQVHAKESLDWLRALLVGKTMRVQLLRKDQYNRIVGVPYIRRRFWFDTPLPPLMIQEGMAVVYEAGGAEYGPWGLDGLKKLEAEARKARKGLWGKKSFEHPADYKRRVKAGEEEHGGQLLRSAKSSGKGGIWRLFKRLLGR